jgi:transglutaminase-like putative cysteine protease
MKYKLRHQTLYEYENIVDNYHSIVCLQPLNLPRQICTDFKIEIDPAPAIIYSRTDYFGNTQHSFSLHVPHKILKVITTSDVEVIPPYAININPISCEEARNKINNKTELKIMMLQYQLPSQFITWDDEIRNFAGNCFPPTIPLYNAIQNLTAKIFNEFEFKEGFSTLNTPLKTILKERKGVCQDFSHLAIACLRSMGFPARYVSGYIETLPPPGKPKLQGSDASHAWIAAYVPDMGWCEFDPTNNLIPYDKHITVAYGRDYGDVVPLKGIIFSSGEHEVKVEVDVIPNYYNNFAI